MKIFYAPKEVPLGCFILIIILFLLVNIFLLPQSSKKNKEIIKSVRIDLSSMNYKKDQDKNINKIINQIKNADVNTVYISPWSDGYANYASEIAPLNNYGKNKFLENFIKIAKENNIKIFSWFVVGKDNFPTSQHPEWYAKTISGKNYLHEDEPGILLPFASLANDNYIKYHLELIKEVNKLDIDGWVISEPLVGWGDMYDDYYTDFSVSSINKFKKLYNVNPKLIFNENSNYYYEQNPKIYNNWINFRAEVVTDFVKQTINTIKKGSTKPIIITIFTEPNENGNLKSFFEIKEWLGMDIKALANLKPDYIEIQSLFQDFEHPQKPEWTSSMIEQFKKQINNDLPLMVSVQGFNVNKLSPEKFSTAIISAQKNNIAGISFYAYHTINEKHWEILEHSW